MPDGRSLAYISYPGMSGVSVVGLDGAAPRLLAEARSRRAPPGRACSLRPGDRACREALCTVAASSQT